MSNVKKEPMQLDFQSKTEIANAIQVLTPLALSESFTLSQRDFAIEKIKELTKLL